MQLNGALHHAGATSQKDRVALNKAHEHLNELQAGFRQSDTARARLENELHEERQEHRMCKEDLDHERARYKQTEKSLECIWNSHNKLGEIMSRVECEVDSNVQQVSRMRYNITELVLELAGKSQRIENLESTLEQTRHQHHDEVLQLKNKLQTESEQHSEDYMNQSQQIHHLDLLLQREHMKGVTMVGNIEPSEDPKPARRRRRFRGKNRANKGNQAAYAENTKFDNEPIETERADTLSTIKEEIF